ncbi:dihydroxyacetone kinase subunit DhaL [Mediterraneibacter sp. ICN-202921]|uniref:dihydroxyacetone kinase subunit DhaL n=1 Tax=Mediterraneibacter sp. ICN-202921 TaxID=3134657 RepID=UPI0030C2C2D6
MKTEELKEMFLAVADKIIQSEDMLTKIDMQIGDGDHGTGMALGFRNVRKELESAEPDSAEEVFKLVGMTLLDTMGGASGVLFGTVFISGITYREPHTEIGLQDLAEIFRQSLDALKKRGKAKCGDKTMVDAFEPAVLSLEESVKTGRSMKEGTADAAKAAKEGMENTKKYRAKFGRAKYFGDNAIGLQDAGATSIWLIFQEIADWVNVHE